MPKTTSSEHVCYALQLYSSGPSLRKTSERLSSLIKRTMYQFGIGFKSKVQAKEDIEKEKERQ
jgi:hypothetical protein